MKNQNYLVCCFLYCFIVLSGCTPEVSNEAIYHGSVYNSYTNEPLVNVDVKVTDGIHIHTQTKTDDKGEFIIEVKLKEINREYFIMIGDDTCEKQVVQFPGFADGIIELGVIMIDGPHAPKVETNEIFSADANTLRCGGKVIDDGRLPILDRGICYSRMAYPTIDDEKFSEGKGSGEYSCVIRNLNIGATYYFRAYATNIEGTSYGSQYQVTMADGLPVVSLLKIDDVKATSAIASGSVDSNGGYDIVQRGFCWADHQLPTVQDEVITDTGKNGEFTLALSPLQLYKKYFVRAFATNSIGTKYSSIQLEFTTTNGCPNVYTGQAESTAKSIQASGQIYDDGGYQITECGICYSTSTDKPSISNGKVMSEYHSGIFYVTIPNLQPSTKYYLRAYAINVNGISYGDTQTITTESGIPEVTINNITNRTATSVHVSATVDNSGGAELISSGICWSNTPNPTISSNKIEAVGNVINSCYTYEISNLLPNTIYYMRAYAITDIATSYSESLNFTTSSGKPSVTTSQNATVGENYLIISGSSQPETGAPIIRQGICWSINPNPSIQDGVVVASALSGAFSCRIEGLKSGTLYYCRAFAESKYGIAYGQSYGFQTEYEPATISGYVYDQDGFPIANATVEGYDITGYKGVTDKNGYYSIVLSKRLAGYCEFSIHAEGYIYQIKEIKINRGQPHRLDVNLIVENPYLLDLGEGVWITSGTYGMYYECTSSSQMGKYTVRNVRIKNNRSVPVSWNLTNIPSPGMSFSPTSGTIPAFGEVSIKATFTYPSTSSYMVTFNNHKAYIWNWSAAYGGYYISGSSHVQSSSAACCWQNAIFMIDGQSEAFSIMFNQFVVF